MTGKIRVLCVDDDVGNRALLRQLLGSEFELQEAATGEEALRILTRVRPDVVLLDIVMPGIDGYETCRRIRADERVRDCKVLLVSSLGRSAERLRGYEVGADDYVVKPYLGDELRAKVRVFGRLHSIEVLDRMKGDLLAILAHELRTPLTGILPAGEVLSSDDELAESSRRMWGEIVAFNGRRLSQLTERGILLCGLRAGQRECRRSEVDVSAVVQQAVLDVAEVAQLRGCTVGLAPPPPLRLVADAELLAEAMLGLIDSAVHLVHEGSTVHVLLTAAGKGLRFVVTMPVAGEHAPLHARLGGVRVRQADGQLVGADLGLALAEEVAEHGGGRVEFLHDGAMASYVLELPPAALATPLASP